VTAAVTRIDGPATESQVVRDMVRRGLMVAPVLVLVCALFWQVDGGVTSLFGSAVVLANFLFAAALMTYSARISLALMMGAVLFGYLIRLGLVVVAYLAVRNTAWFSKGAFGLTIIVMHLGLLMWETKYVSATLAFPGLKPQRTK
jgi:hypothetical protein